MGHCVNSYWQYINQDTCAIYSFTAGEKRYTAEFRVGSNGKYTVRQIQSKYDRGCPDYEDTQIIVNGVPSCKFHICPECKRKVIEKAFGKINEVNKKGDRK